MTVTTPSPSDQETVVEELREMFEVDEETGEVSWDNQDVSRHVFEHLNKLGLFKKTQDYKALGPVLELLVWELLSHVDRCGHPYQQYARPGSVAECAVLIPIPAELLRRLRAACTSGKVTTLFGPRGIYVELNRYEVFPDDPGEGTPAVVRLPGYYGTYWMCSEEGTLEHEGTSEIRRLDKAQREWIEQIRDQVEDFLFGEETECG